MQWTNFTATCFKIPPVSHCQLKKQYNSNPEVSKTYIVKASDGLQKIASHSCSRKSTENTEGLKPAFILKCGAGVNAFLLG
jgi:hypothetical protein